MQAIGKKFRTFEEGEASDDEFFRTLKPRERMEIFFELLSYARDYEAEIAAGFPRVSRIVKLPRR